MSVADDKLRASAKRLCGEIATLEATLGDKRAKLAGIEAKLTGAPPPVTGLDLLWAAALPKSRERSSKHQCRTEWSRIPKAERPAVQTAVDALKSWNRTEEWRKDGNTFAPGLHRFIQRRMWEDLPESATPASRYRPTPAPRPASLSTDDDRAALLQFLSKKPTALIHETIPSTPSD
jgi:hypothetical protein